MAQGVLDALNFGFSHTLKSSHFASVAIKLVMEKAKQSTVLNYLGSITQ